MPTVHKNGNDTCLVWAALEWVRMSAQSPAPNGTAPSVSSDFLLEEIKNEIMNVKSID